MANFRGTNIPDNTLDALRAEDPGKYDRILAKLADAIEANDSRAANDAIFSIAYFSNQKPGSQEYGYDKTEEVSNIHSSKWRVTAEEIDSYLPWAVEHVNSSNSSYMLYNGQLVTYDDMKGAAIDGKIVNSWGQRGHTEAGGKLGKDNPYEGDKAAAPTNPTHVGEPGGGAAVRKLWPKVDWDGGGANSGNMEQYDWWESKGLLNEKGWIGEGGFEWPEVDPQILDPGAFGFSKETPEAGYSYPQYNYLNKAGIGQNLAYSPEFRSAWRGGETAADREAILAAGGTPTYYTGMAGGAGQTDAAGNTTYPLMDRMYYYGGESPMNVPGGWTPQTPPARPASEVIDFPEGDARQPVYPIARTPLFPSGLLSPEGALPEGPVDPVDPVDPVVGNPAVDTYGALLSKYAQRMGVTPGTVGNYMYRATGEPYKVSGVTGGTGPDRAYDSYRLPLTVYGSQGGPQETFATRLSSAEGWDPSMNMWTTRQVPNAQGITPSFNINFADWAGTPGSYVGTEREARHPVFGGLLSNPQNVMTADPTSGLKRQVPWQSGLLEDSLSPSWLASRQPSMLGAAPYQEHWGMPEFYGVSERGGGGADEAAGDVYGTNVIGYGMPEWRSNWSVATDPNTGAEIPWGPAHPDWTGAEG
jgi:hypothetical protein